MVKAIVNHGRGRPREQGDSLDDPEGQAHDTTADMPKKLKNGPATERLQIVAPVSLIQDVDAFRREYPDLPNRSEAIRLLVAEALEMRRTKSRKP